MKFCELKQSIVVQNEKACGKPHNKAPPYGIRQQILTNSDKWFTAKLFRKTLKFRQVLTNSDGQSMSEFAAGYRRGVWGLVGIPYPAANIWQRLVT